MASKARLEARKAEALEAMASTIANLEKSIKRLEGKVNKLTKALEEK